MKEKKLQNVFPAGSLFLVFLKKSLSRCPSSINLPPRDLKNLCFSNCWVGLCLSNCWVGCTVTLCYVLHQIHSELSIQYSVFSGIWQHIQSYLTLLKHIQVYWDIKAYSDLFRHIQHPCIFITLPYSEP